MFKIDEMLSKRNIKDALNYLSSKKNTSGADGICLSELKNYWEINHELIEEQLRNGTYEPGVVKCYEITVASGKKRIVSVLNTIDRFIARLLAQKLNRYYDPLFLPNSYAFRDNKGTVKAVTQAKIYADQGYSYVTKIDIRHFFDSIPLDKMMKLVRHNISDSAVRTLIKKYLYCNVYNEGEIIEKDIGLLQGNPISPVLSNLYLHLLDYYMEKKGYKWIRFADDITVYSKTIYDAKIVMNDINYIIVNCLDLNLNKNKSSVCHIQNLRLLGYDFYLCSGKYEAKKHVYQKSKIYNTWTPSIIQKVNKEYHIVQDGILHKKDYALLFENPEEKHHIPVEAVDQLNLYGEISIDFAVLQTITHHKIRLAFFDKFGNIMGYYLPEESYSSSHSLLLQSIFYNDQSKRAALAKSMEIANIHNMRANLRYYNKKRENHLKDSIHELTEFIGKISTSTSIEEMLLLEARAREKYYHTFSTILLTNDFPFEKRTRRPPKNELNALISFGNTLLYNEILQIIWKTSLDSRIGIIHATNKRNHTLNLDFADIFKPIIIDRLIFSLINRKQIKKEIHFINQEDRCVLLNKEGKKIFLQEFYRKLSGKINKNGCTYTYKQLLQREIHLYEKYVVKNEIYKPFKYY